MKTSWRTELPQWLLIAGMFVLAALTWSWAPNRIPVHWGLNGQIDRYGGKVEGLLLMPALALGLYLLLLLAPRVDPGRANYRTFAGTYAALRIIVLAVLALFYGAAHLWIRNQALDITRLVSVLLGVLLVLLGSLMGKIRPNWFAGIRTPWTLSSKAAWVRTHRVGGWLFTLLGLAVAAAALVQVAWVTTAVAALLVGSIVFLTVYSYLVWRADPDKVPPAGTLPADGGFKP